MSTTDKSLLCTCPCVPPPPPKVSAIYMWNIISYDVLGIHYMSSSNQGSYRDNQVAGMIAGHNAAVRS